MMIYNCTVKCYEQRNPIIENISPAAYDADIFRSESSSITRSCLSHVNPKKFQIEITQDCSDFFGIVYSGALKTVWKTYRKELGNLLNVSRRIGSGSF